MTTERACVFRVASLPPINNGWSRGIHSINTSSTSAKPMLFDWLCQHLLNRISHFRRREGVGVGATGSAGTG